MAVTSDSEIELPTRRAMRRFAGELASILRVGDVVFLEGPLGAGKTFLARGIARALGVPEREPITSPTFTLVQQIESGRIPILHADLYRLGHAADLDELGLSEALSRSVGLIEWGERFASELSGDGLVLRIAPTGDHARRVQAVARGPRGEQLGREAIQRVGRARSSKSV